MLGRFFALSLTMAVLCFFTICIAGNGRAGSSPSLKKSRNPGKDAVVQSDSAQSELVGLWQCYKQEDRAKLPSCLYSIEFLADGGMVQKTNVDGYSAELRCDYSIEGKRIDVKALPAAWHFDFKVLANGDLYLHKAPWNWKGWLTKDSTRVTKDHGCGSIGTGVSHTQR
jgi:hypothetical protein